MLRRSCGIIISMLIWKTQTTHIEHVYFILQSCTGTPRDRGGGGWGGVAGGAAVIGWVDHPGPDEVGAFVRCG